MEAGKVKTGSCREGMLLWNQELRDSCEEWNGTEEESVLSARKNVEREMGAIRRFVKMVRRRR